MKKIFTCFAGAGMLLAQLHAAPTFTVDASHSAGRVSPLLYGLMTEEINHSYDGGLYAELINNRAFLDSSNAPVHWSVMTEPGAAASMALDPQQSFNDQLSTSLRLTVTSAAEGHLAGLANSGYWGIPIQPHTRYHAAILAKAGGQFMAPVTVSLESDDGQTIYARESFSGLTADWHKFEVTLKTGKAVPTTAARMVIALDRPGTVWFGMVSLFPPTWHDQPNGFRKDLMQMLVDLQPKFLRFPGGNYVEGDTVGTRFDWKRTIGPVEARPGHPCPWGYRSTDGLGLLEFLKWCEDMNAEPVLAVYAGYSLRGAHINPGADLNPFVKDALDEIEYVTGDEHSTWGAQRAKDGHPKPFKLTYVEIGNEDWFDKSKSYNDRFTQFYDAIKAQYPQLQLISTIGNDQPDALHVHSRKPDVIDEHYYRSTDEFVALSPDYARSYDRSGPGIFVGEWAAHEDAAIKPWEAGARKQPPTPTLKAALGDAVFMAAMERNADLIRMQCYAPLLVNVNPGARQWRPDMIGYDALTAYGSPSYYAFQMFSRNLGDEMLAVTSQDTAVQGSATRDRDTGDIILKLVNPQATPETLEININGAASLGSKGRLLTLAGSPEDTNSINRPRNVVPVASVLRHIQPHFAFTLAPNSLVVLRLKRT
jgi:alpha-N-arabinofuranosidase